VSGNLLQPIRFRLGSSPSSVQKLFSVLPLLTGLSPGESPFSPFSCFPPLLSPAPSPLIFPQDSFLFQSNPLLRQPTFPSHFFAPFFRVFCKAFPSLAVFFLFFPALCRPFDSPFFPDLRLLLDFSSHVGVPFSHHPLFFFGYPFSQAVNPT